MINGKLDDIVKQAHDEKEKPFLNLPHRNASTTAYVCSVIEKNYPEVDALYSEYIKLEDWKKEYITTKIKQKYKKLFTPFNLKQNSDIITFIGMHVFNQLADYPISRRTAERFIIFAHLFFGCFVRKIISIAFFQFKM